MRAGSRAVFVSSIASFVPNAYMAVYSATKAYVTSYARALRYELKGRKIGVTVVCPGPMDTEFIAAGGVKSKTFEKLPYCDVRKVAAGTLRAAHREKAHRAVVHAQQLPQAGCLAGLQAVRVRLGAEGGEAGIEQVEAVALAVIVRIGVDAQKTGEPHQEH